MCVLYDDDCVTASLLTCSSSLGGGLCFSSLQILAKADCTQTGANDPFMKENSRKSKENISNTVFC